MLSATSNDIFSQRQQKHASYLPPSHPLTLSYLGMDNMWTHSSSIERISFARPSLDCRRLNANRSNFCNFGKCTVSLLSLYFCFLFIHVFFCTYNTIIYLFLSFYNYYYYYCARVFYDFVALFSLVSLSLPLPSFCYLA